MRSCVSVSSGHVLSRGQAACLVVFSLCLLRVYAQHYDPGYQQVFYPAPPPPYYYYPQPQAPPAPPPESGFAGPFVPSPRYQPPTYTRAEPSPATAVVASQPVAAESWKLAHPVSGVNEFNLAPPTAMALPPVEFPSPVFPPRPAANYNYTRENPPSPSHKRRVVYTVPQERRNRILPRKQRRLEQFEESHVEHSDISSSFNHTPSPPVFASSSVVSKRLRIRTTTTPSVDLETSRSSVLTDLPEDDIDPNKVFFTCCKSKNVHKACESKCNFDRINKKTLTHLFLGIDPCPQSYGLDLFSCAASHADHTTCCRKKNVQRTKAGEKCLAFCDLRPNHTFQADGTHLPCWAVLNDVKNCFKEAIINRTV